jgi:hypothetical protein
MALVVPAALRQMGPVVRAVPQPMAPVGLVELLRMALAGLVNFILSSEGEIHTMLSLDVYSASFRKPVVERTALHRLFAAAVVSDQFRKTLLREPEKALANGYLGQTFPLTDQEKKIIKTIRAENLSDLAQKVNQALKTI